MMVVEFKGNRIALQSKWLRITQNPRAVGYPCTGDEVHLEGHKILIDGQHVVQMVKEYEPPFHADAESRDIRITFLGIEHEFNGQEVLRAIKASSSPQDTKVDIVQDTKVDIVQDTKVDMSISMGQVLELKKTLDDSIRNLIRAFEEDTWMRIDQIEIQRINGKVSVVSCAHVSEEKV